MTAPRGPGGPGKPGGPPPTPGPKRNEPGSIDAMIKKRQAEDRVKDDIARQKKKKLIKTLSAVGAGLVGVLVLAAGVFWFIESRKGCGATEMRRKAVDVVMEQGEPEAGTLIKERFPDRKAYRCSDHAGPRGVLVSVSEDSGDPIVWFVDLNGKPMNVNLLAVSWTPKLAASPPISDKAVAKVLK